jgi:hypothetical protein
VDIETILSQAAAARGLNDNQLISHFAALDAEAERLRSEGGHPTQERRIVLGQTFLSEERSRRLAELGQVQGALAASGGFNAPRGSASHLERMWRRTVLGSRHRLGVGRWNLSGTSSRFP